MVGTTRFELAYHALKVRCKATLLRSSKIMKIKRNSVFSKLKGDKVNLLRYNRLYACKKGGKAIHIPD